MDFRHTQVPKFPLYMENRDKGQYRVFRWTTGSGAQYVVYPNQTSSDPAVRKLFQTKDFRAALSLAVDRAKINDISTLGLGKVRQATVIPDSPYYVPEAEMVYAKYDPAEANRLLDALGLKKGADGKRTMPDGKPLEITVEGQFTQPGPDTDAYELVRSFWEAVGVKTALKPSERSLYWDRACGNQVNVATWGMDRAIEPFVDPIYIIPYANRSWFAPAYGTWYETGGAKGEKPEGDYAKAIDLYEQFKHEVDPQKQIDLGKQMVKLAADNLWMIGLTGAADTIIVVKNNFRNVPEKAISDWIYMTPGNLDPHTFFFKK
jgi:peptide/nickel transport system substrate-binding protein